MFKNSLNFNAILLCLFFFLVSCGNKVVAPPIGNNISYPGSIVALNSTHFLMLNTTANGDYNDGSIQQYVVDSAGNQSLQNVISIPQHASEMAVSPDASLVAVSFDNSVNYTKINFYNYTDPSAPVLIDNLNLNFNEAGGKQDIKRLGFFTPSLTPNDSSNFYYLYGMIYSAPQNDGSNSNVPNRVFVAKIAKDFSSSSIMFTLSYGLGDPNSLAPKSNSLVPLPYSFGSSAPTFDSAHNLFLAFPTGSVGDSDTTGIAYPPIPNVYNYLSGQADANTASCGIVAECSQPDMRVASLFAVDFTSILSGEPLNNSTYFAPLAWNANGIPYGAVTSNNITVNYAAYNSAGGSSNSDLNSLSFQTNFWSSYWLNSPNLGDNNSQCYTSAATTSANEYSISSVGQNALLVAKSQTNGGLDGGYGNEIFQITGLDVLGASINYLHNNRGGLNMNGENDFNQIASIQILDPFNAYYSSYLKSIWLNGDNATNGLLPVVPYMYSRTTTVNSFDSVTTIPFNFGILNFGSNSCLPFWIRDTIGGYVSFGLDSSWLSANPVAITAGSNPVFYNATNDPTQLSIFSFPYQNGSQTCTILNPVTNTPKVFCANFLRGTISHFNTAFTGTVFTQY